MNTDEIAQRVYQWSLDAAEVAGVVVFRFDPRSAFTLSRLRLAPWLELERVEIHELIGHDQPVLLEQLVPCDHDVERAPDYADAPERVWTWPTLPLPRIEPGQRLEVVARSPRHGGGWVQLRGSGLLPPADGALGKVMQVSPSPHNGAPCDDLRDFVRAVVVLTVAQRSLLSLECGRASSIEQDVSVAIEQAERAWPVLQGKGYA